MKMTETVFAAGKYKNGKASTLGNMIESGQAHIRQRAGRRNLQRALQVKHAAGKVIGKIAKRAVIGGAIGASVLGGAALLRRRQQPRQTQELSLALPSAGKLFQMGRIGLRKVGRAFGQVKRQVQGMAAPDVIQRVRQNSLNRKAQQAATIAKQKADFAAKPKSMLGRVGQFARGAGRATVNAGKAAFNPKNIGHAAIGVTGIGVGAAMARRSPSPLDDPDGPRTGWKARY
jgi:hypothetical protein